MNIIKLTVEYESNYSSIKEHMLLPNYINGLIVPRWEEGTVPEAVWMGEVDGKHSECYGDLTVEFINLDNMNPLERVKLLENTNYEQFESYFESNEIEFVEELEEDNHYGKMKLQEQRDLLEKAGISWSGGPMARVWEESLMKHLDEKYMKVKQLTVNGDDYKKAIELLKSNGIKVYEERS